MRSTARTEGQQMSKSKAQTRSRRSAPARPTTNLPAVIEHRPEPERAPLPALLGELVVWVRYSVSREEVVERRFSVGTTLAELVEQLGGPQEEHLTPAIWLNGNQIRPEHFTLIRPKSSALISVAFIPGDSRTAILIGASLAIAALAIAAPPLAGLTAGSLGAVALSAGIPIGGALGINSTL
jgi:hypothetical protein